MDFDFSEQQTMLKTMAADFLSKECTKAQVRVLEKDEKGYDPAVWNKMVELGWQGLVLPEQYGGMGAEFLDLVVLMEEMGKNILPGPFYSTVGLCAMPLIRFGKESQKAGYLPLIADGTNIWSLAVLERSGVFAPAEIACRAEYDGKNYVINGEKWFAQYAHIANWLLVICRTGQGPQDLTGFIIDTKKQGVRTEKIPTVAGDGQCIVKFKNVRVSSRNVLGKKGQGWKILDYLAQRALVLKCAEIAGACQAVLTMTQAYAKDRVQFDKPIGSFMTIQHKLVDMLTDVEGLQYLVYQAAWLISSGQKPGAAVALAKAKADDVYQRICIDAVRIHGAIGFTMDHDMGCYFRRIKGAEFTLGDTGLQLEAIAAGIGL
jgi:alkylation response protein AidB-like acyl-CoA dehydrogenase